MHSQIFNDYILDKFFLKSLEHENQKFPLFNVGQHKANPDLFILQIAVAGYTTDDLHISLEKNILTISSKEPSACLEEDYTYAIVNIARRKFIRRFTLFNEGVSEVNRAVLKDGILSIYIERVIPDEDKPRTIPIVAADSLNPLNMDQYGSIKQ